MAKEKLSGPRLLVALLVGFLGAAVICLLVPYNNYLLGNNPISDSYIPEIALALLLLIVLCINPVLGHFSPASRLTRRQMALVLGIWLMACVAPGRGGMGVYPYVLAKATALANTNKAMADAHETMKLPPILFPDRLEMGAETPVSDGFLTKLEDGESIPWRAWLGPLLGWGPLLLGTWMMMIGMGVIVYPQWRERERLAFPLLTMYESLIETPEQGRRFPPVLRSPLFWAGALTVMVLHSFNGLNSFTHGGFPSFPLEWNFWVLFQDGIWRNAPWTLRGGRIYFALLGVVYFMPNRTSFSIWFGVIGFAIYFMIKTAYFPVAGDYELDVKTGAWFAYAMAILWLGRMHWKEVGRAMLSRSADETVARDRTGGWLFALGIAAMLGWFLWVGLSLGASLIYVIFGILLTLLAARVICETGLPIINFTPLQPFEFISAFPLRGLSTAAIYIGGIVSTLFNYGARVSAGVMCCLSMGLDRDRTPREQMRWGQLLLVVLVLCSVGAGVVHLKMAYTHEATLDGAGVLGHYGTTIMDRSMPAVTKFEGGGHFSPGPLVRWPRFAVGVAIATSLQVACMLFPRWPFHPIAFLFVGSWLGDAIWPSIFLGWLLKTLITTYGGARAYRAARPVFLGLLLGEVFAVILWALVPVVLVLCGYDAAELGKVRILLD